MHETMVPRSRRSAVASGTRIPKIVRVNLLRRHPIALGLIVLVMLSALTQVPPLVDVASGAPPPDADLDRKSTRLNSSHSQISYAVFCLKKKKINKEPYTSIH